MKPVHQILLIVIGAAFGYAAGVYWPASHENPKSSASAAPGVASDVPLAQREKVRIVDQLIETITSPRTLADYANLDRAFDSMSSADFAEFARHLGRIPTESRKRALTLWLSQWLRCDQAAASAWMREQLDRRRHDGTIGYRFTLWATSSIRGGKRTSRTDFGPCSNYRMISIAGMRFEKRLPNGFSTTAPRRWLPRRPCHKGLIGNQRLRSPWSTPPKWTRSARWSGPNPSGKRAADCSPR
jgi:hypothetical protein